MSTKQTRNLSSPGWCMAVLCGAMYFLSAGAAAQGYWRLDGERVWVGPLASDPKSGVTWNGFAYQSKDREVKGAFGCNHSWTQPPSALVPDQVFAMRFRVEITADPGGGHLGCSIGAYLNDDPTPIGYTGGIWLFKNGVHQAPRNPSVERGGRNADEQLGKAPVPGNNKGHKLYLRIGAGPGSVPAMKGIYYSYSWVPGAAPPAASVPPGSPPGSVTTATCLP